MDVALHAMGLSLLDKNTAAFTAEGRFKPLVRIDTPVPKGRRYQGKIPRPKEEEEPHGAWMHGCECDTWYCTR